MRKFSGSAHDTSHFRSLEMGHNILLVVLTVLVPIIFIINCAFNALASQPQSSGGKSNFTVLNSAEQFN